MLFAQHWNRVRTLASVHVHGSNTVHISPVSTAKYSGVRTEAVWIMDGSCFLWVFTYCLSDHLTMGHAAKQDKSDPDNATMENHLMNSSAIAPSRTKSSRSGRRSANSRQRCGRSRLPPCHGDSATRQRLHGCVGLQGGSSATIHGPSIRTSCTTYKPSHLPATLFSNWPRRVRPCMYRFATRCMRSILPYKKGAATQTHSFVLRGPPGTVH